MAEYRRLRVAGGFYFFTVCLRDRRSDLLVGNIALLRQAVKRVRAERPFTIDAWTVLPEHLHAVWTLPDGDDDFSGRWRAIKALFSRGVAFGPANDRGEHAVWQRRFWEHAIRDEQDFAAHVNYVHFNAVRHGLVRHAADWPYSTFHRAVRAGQYPADWIDTNTDLEIAGEP